MPPRIKYTVPLKPLKGRAIPPARTRSQMLREQLRARGISEDTVELLAQEIETGEEQVRKTVLPTPAPAKPEKRRVIKDFAAEMLPEGVRPAPSEIIPSIFDEVDPNPDVLSVFLRRANEAAGQQRLPLEAAPVPEPKPRRIQDVLRLGEEIVPKQKEQPTYKDPVTGERVLSQGPGETWGQVFLGELPSEKTLSMESRELAGVERLKGRLDEDSREGQLRAAGARVEKPQILQHVGEQDLGPAENRVLEAAPEYLREELARRYATLRKGGRMGPDEFARMVHEHRQKLANEEDLFRFEDLSHDLNTRLALNRPVRVTGKAAKEHNVDSISMILDSVKDMDPIQAAEIKRLYAPSVDDIPGEVNLARADESTPGGRGLQQQARAQKPINQHEPVRRPLVSPAIRKQPLEPGLGDDSYMVEAGEFAKSTRMLSDSLAYLKEQEKKTLALARTLKKKDPQGKGKQLKQARAELGVIRSEILATQEEINEAGKKLASIRESGHVTQRPTGDMLEVEREGPQSGAQDFPFKVGDWAKRKDKNGNLVLVQIEHKVPSEHVVEGKDERRGWALREGKLINNAKTKSEGPLPTHFNKPLVLRNVPTSGVGETVSYTEKKRVKNAKGEWETVKTEIPWSRRTLENAPVVRVRYPDGSMENVEGSTLLPVDKAEQILKLQGFQKAEQYLAQPELQQNIDFNTGRSREEGLEQRVSQATSRLRYTMVDPKVDANGQITVRQKGSKKNQKMSVESARKNGLLPEGAAPRVNTSEPPVITGKEIPNGLEAKSFPARLEPGMEVRTPQGLRTVDEVKATKDGRIQVLFRSGTASVLAGSAIAQLFSEDEDEEGPMQAGFRIPKMFRPKPVVPRSKIRSVVPSSNARVETQTIVPGMTRMQKELFNKKAILTDGAFHGDSYGNSKLVPGGTHNPETSPAYALQGLMEGGGSVPEQYVAKLERIMAPVQDAGLEQTLRDVLNYERMDRAWRLVQEKIIEDRSLYHKLLREGKDSTAEQVLRGIQDMEAKVAKNEVVPEGYTPDSIKSELDALKAGLAPDQLARVNAGLKNIQGLMRELLDYAKENGLVTPEAYKKYTSRGAYLPVHRLLALYDPDSETIIRREGEMDYQQPTTSSRLNLSDETVIAQELRGGKHMMEDPIRDIFNMINGVGNEAVRNKGAELTFKYYAEHGEEPEMQAKYGNLYAVKRLPVEPTGPAPQGKGYVSFLENGRPVWYEADVEFAAAAKAFHPEVAQDIFGKGFNNLRVWAQMFSATMSPAFAASQVTKDGLALPFTPHFNKYEKNSWKGSGDIKMFQRVLISAIRTYQKKAGMALRRGLVGKEAAFNYEDRMNAKIDKQLPGYLDFLKSPVQSRPLGSQLRQEEGLYGGIDAIKRAKGIGETGSAIARSFSQTLIDSLMSPLEASFKYAGRQRLLERGYGETEANFQGRTAVGTPDWNERGAIMDREVAMVGRLPEWIMFVVPSMAGLRRMAKGMKDHPASYAKAAMYGGAAVASAYGWNSQFTDDQGNKEMDKIPWDEWMSNMIFILPREFDASSLGPLSKFVRSTGSDRNPYVKIPMPLELMAMLRPVLIAMREQKDTRNQYSAAQNVADAVLPMLPMGGGNVDVKDPISVVDSVVSSLNPLPRYIYETGTGRQTFTRSPIVGSRVEQNIPEYEKTLRTHPTYSALGRNLGVSPDKLQHAASTFLGPYAEFAAGAARPFITDPKDNPLGDLRTGPEALAQAPIVGPIARRFLGTGVADQTMMDLKSRFYRASEQAREASRTINSLKARDPWELQQLMVANKALMETAGLNPTLTKYQRSMSELDARREQIIRNPQMPPQEKQAQLKMLWNRERETLSQIDSIIAIWEERGLIKP